MSSSSTIASSSESVSTYTGPTPAFITAFTAPTSCTVDISQVGISGQCYDEGSSAPCQFFHLGPYTSLTDCYPASYDPDPEFFYSPGFCPANYATACSATSAYKTGGSTVTETIITCCPTGYECQTGDDLLLWQTFDHCTSQMTMSQQLIYTTTVVGKGEVTYTETRQEGINAYGIVVHHQSTDTPPVTSMPSSSGASTTSGATVTSTSGGNSTAGGSTGLSAGAKAGVGIGAAIGVIAVLGLIGAAVLLRRRKQMAANDDMKQSMIAHDSLGPNAGGGPGGGGGDAAGAMGGYAAAAGVGGAYAAGAYGGGPHSNYAASTYGGSVYGVPAAAYSDQPAGRLSPAPPYGGAAYAPTELPAEQTSDPAQDSKAAELQALPPTRLVEAP